MIRALGAQPIELPYGQVETGLATGLVDGAENNWPSFVTTNHYKLARNYTLTEHTMSPEVLMMSLRAWQSLSDGDKIIFREAARESNRFMREQWGRWKRNRNGRRGRRASSSFPISTANRSRRRCRTSTRRHPPMPRFDPDRSYPSGAVSIP